MTLAEISIYDPRRLADGTFLASFVARLGLAQTLLDGLRIMVPAEAGGHQLLLGQRGMGKTTMLRRTALGVESDSELSARYLPLVFREEQYNVRSLAAFWKNCVEALAEWYDDHEQQERGARLDRALGARWQEVGGAAQLFADEMKALSKRAILLTDNFDLVLTTLSKEEQLSLRHSLEVAGGPILIAASSRMDATSGTVFEGFFSTTTLEPLTEQELTACLTRLAQRRGDPGKQVLKTIASQPHRLRVLHNLTGGNPRILVLIYQLLERADGASAFEDLSALLDQLTPYYKAKIEEYSNLQRAVIDAVALNWNPVTSAEIQNATGIEVTTISSQLSRLRSDGLVVEVRSSGTRAAYQIGERFFNIWYLMRHGTRRLRQKMKWLTAFLSSFYSRDELAELSSAPGGLGDHPAVTEALTAALMEHGRGAELKDVTPTAPAGELKDTRMPKSTRPHTLASIRSHRESEVATVARSLGRRDWTASEEDAKELLDELIALDPKNRDPAVWISIGNIYQDFFGDVARAERAYRSALHADADNPRALTNLADLLVDSDKDVGAARQMFEQAIKQSPKDPWARISLAQVVARQGDFELAEQELRAATELNSAGSLPWINLGNLYRDKLNRSDEALDAYVRAIEVDPEDPRAWVSKSKLLRRQGDPAEAERALRNAIRIAPDSIRARTELARAKLEDGVFQEAEVHARQAIEIEQADSSLWELLSLTLHAQERFDESIEAMRAALSLDSESAFGWRFLAHMLGSHAKEFTAAEEAILKSIEIERGADAYHDYGDLLSEHGRPEQAIVAWRQAIEIDPAVGSGHSIAHALEKLGRSDEAKVEFERAIERAPDDAGVKVCYADLLHRIGLYEEALTVCKAALESDEKRAVAWFNQAELYHFHLSNVPEAERSYRKAMELAPQIYAPRECLAALLEENGRESEAEELYRSSIESLPADPEPFCDLAQLLRDSGRIDEAQALYRRAVEIEPKSVRAWVGLGRLHLGLTEVEEAEIAFGKAMGAAGDNAIRWAHLGRLFAQVPGREYDAEESFRQSLALDGENPRSWVGLARLYRKQRQFDKAATSYRTAMKLENDPARRPAIEFGNLLFDNVGDLEAALEIYECAHESPAKHLHLAWLSLALRRSDEAIRHSKKALAIQGHSRIVLDAAVALQLENFGEAMGTLANVLNEPSQAMRISHSNDLLRFLRLAKARGYAERVIEWMEETEKADEVAPLFAAFVAFTRGKEALLDVNPEVRLPAEVILDWLRAEPDHPEDSKESSRGANRRTGAARKRA